MIIDNSKHTYDVFAQIILFLLILLKCAAISCSMYIFIKAPQVHRNLIFTVYNLCLEAVLFSFCKLAVIIEWVLCYKDCYDESWLLLSRPLFYVELVRLVIGCAYVIGMPFVIIERTLATIKLKTYEKDRNNIFIIVSIATQYSGGTLGTYIIYNEIIPLTYIFIAAEMGCLAFIILFFVIDRINKQKYRSSVRIGTSYTLRERFQLSENVRLSKLLRNCIILGAIGGSVITLFFTLIWYIDKYEYKIWLKFAYDFLAEIFGILFAIVGIFSCDIWRKHLFKILKKARQIVPFYVSHKTVPHENNICTTDGKLMFFTRYQEKQIYFDQLQQAWRK